MIPDFSVFRDFYFLRCFSKEEYQEDFNAGRKVYINSVRYFHDLEDDFQRDFEGGIFQQPPGVKGFLLRANANLTTNEAIDKAINRKLDSSEWIIPTTDLKFYVNGYIFCLTIIPKRLIKFTDTHIMFNDEQNISDSFYFFLNQYAKDNKYAYITLYDAEKFIEAFYSQMAERGYQISYGCVEYEDLTPELRRKYYSEGQIAKLIFTKDNKYSYQHEFRIFLQQRTELKSHIEECGIIINSSIIKNMVYLSPEYVKEIECSKNEIQL